MPDFTFIKHGWKEDPNLTMTFNTDSLETIRECFEDFVQGAGFVSPEKNEEDFIFIEKNDCGLNLSEFRDSYFNSMNKDDSLSYDYPR